ncbi:MAG: amidohydrolase family protein [Deltaproteobacteria bacterium]|nr:amidohydrolase family protein [Deltaproteobacteria bacterium]
MSYRFRFLFALVAVAALSACPPDPEAGPDASSCSCGSKVCGTDPCGNSCGTCDSPKECNVAGQCVAPDKCANANCSAGETCDAADGVCKCTTGSCPAEQVCSVGLRCVPVGDPCADKQCTADPTLPVCSSGECVCRESPDSCGDGKECVDGACQAAGLCAHSNCTGTTPVCNPTSGACQCRATPSDSCGANSHCVDGACQPVSKCENVTCAQGETCDQADGICKCTTGSCPQGESCSSTNLQCFPDGHACLTLSCTGTTPVCDRTSAACVCRGSPSDSCGNGQRCVAGVCGSGVVIEECGTLPPTSNGKACEVTAGASGKILIKGTILLPGSVLRGGQVLVGADQKIECVDCDCSLAAASATVVSCPDAVVSPGLINTHDHIPFAVAGPKPTTERFEHRHDWRHGLRGHHKISVRSDSSPATIGWSELRFLVGGATSTVSSGSADGFLRNLDDANNEEGLGQPAADFETFPLGDSGFDDQPTSGCGAYPRITPGSVDAYLPHIGEGVDEVAHNEMLCTESTANGGKDIINEHTGVIHGVAVFSNDTALFAQDRAKLIWSPRSNVSLYGNTAPVTLYSRLGALIALGTDWLPSGSMNMLRELRCAADLNSTYYNHYFTDEDLWRMVTINGAITTAMDDAIGILKPGLFADIAIFAKNGHVDYAAVIEAEPKDVLLVLRGGEALYGEASTMSALRSGCDALEVCGQAKQVCASDANTTLSALQTANSSYYALFFCGEPTSEPSCKPMRNDPAHGATYSGDISASDLDGDGVLNGVDNCPNVFNPVRPMDGAAQADSDQDGVGDVCDPCPLDPHTATCTVIDPDDLDSDGIPNADDNCPTVANLNQADADGDDKGDACDRCPNASNPGATPCPGTIYQVRNGTLSDGSTVSLPNVLVTAVGARGFFIQAKPGDPGYNGADFSGVYVFTGAIPAPAVVIGNRINIATATVTTFKN